MPQLDRWETLPVEDQQQPMELASNPMPELKRALVWTSGKPWVSKLVFVLVPFVYVACAVWINHIRSQDSTGFRTVLAWFFIATGVLINVELYLFHTRVVRSDKLGALDILQDKIVPLDEDGITKALAPAERWAAQAKLQPVIQLILGAVAEWADVTTGWSSKGLHVVITIGWIVGTGCVSNPSIHVQAAACIACCAIVCDNISQETHSLAQISKQGHEWDFDRSMTTIHDLKKMTAECERCGVGLVITAVGYALLGGFLVYFVACGNSPSVLFSVNVLFLSAVFFMISIDLLRAPMHVTTAWMDLQAEVNDLYCFPKVAKHEQVHVLMAFFEKLNGGNGPGFNMLGLILRPSAIAGLASSMASVIVGTGLRVILDMSATSEESGSNEQA